MFYLDKQNLFLLALFEPKNYDEIKMEKNFFIAIKNGFILKRIPFDDVLFYILPKGTDNTILQKTISVLKEKIENNEIEKQNKIYFNEHKEELLKHKKNYVFKKIKLKGE